MVYTGTMIEELIAAVQREERRLAARNEQACELSEVLGADILFPGDEQLRVCAGMQFAQTA